MKLYHNDRPKAGGPLRTTKKQRQETTQPLDAPSSQRRHRSNKAPRFASVDPMAMREEGQKHGLRSTVHSTQNKDDSIIKLLEECNISMFPRGRREDADPRRVVEQNEGVGLIVGRRVSTVHVFAQRNEKPLSQEEKGERATVITKNMEWGRLFPTEMLEAIYCGDRRHDIPKRTPPPLPIPKRVSEQQQQQQQQTVFSLLKNIY